MCRQYSEISLCKVVAVGESVSFEYEFADFEEVSSTKSVIAKVNRTLYEGPNVHVDEFKHDKNPMQW